MPVASLVKCTVISKLWLTPSVVQIRFEPSKRFEFEAGQFISVMVPGGTPLNPMSQPVRRIYSLASPYSAHRKEDRGIYELCIKNVGGPGTRYLSALEKGDLFKASAPYGDFFYESRPGRSACFISTGTGVAPFKAMILSERFQEQPPESALVLFGARTEDEIIYSDLFQKYGVNVLNAVSKPSPAFLEADGFKGRVTDYLKSLPEDWAWHTTDFYMCGNGEMVSEVRRILRASHNVPESSIFQEVYFSTHVSTSEQPQSPQAEKIA